MFLGRVVGSGDPQWLDTDRAYALAWTENKRATCPGCGTRADEWAEDEDAYISDHYTCEGCAALAQEKTANLDRAPDGSFLPGQHAYLKPRELYELEVAIKTAAATAPDDSD